MASMKKKNTFLTFAILIPVCIAAYIANVLIPYNYMFLMEGDGTPYDIVYNRLNGNKVLYPLSVVAMFLVYIVAFRTVYDLIKSKCPKKASEEKENAEAEGNAPEEDADGNSDENSIDDPSEDNSSDSNDKDDSFREGSNNSKF